MSKFERWILDLSATRKFVNFTRNVHIIGMEGITLYQLGIFFFRELRTLKIIERAAATTYNFLMAMPPTFLLMLTLVPYLPLNHVGSSVLTALQLITPNAHSYQTVSAIVTDFMNRPRRGIMSFSILLVLFFSSNGMMGLMRSFDSNRSLYKKRSSLKRRWTAVKLTLLNIFVAITTLSVLAIQSEVLNTMILQMFHNLWAIRIISGAILVIIIFLSISLIYKYGPSLYIRFHFLSAGSVFTTICSLLATVIFFFFVNHFINYDKIYGSIGTLIVFMIWVWLNVLVILIGYELNVSIMVGRMKSGDTAHVTFTEK